MSAKTSKLDEPEIAQLSDDNPLANVYDHLKVLQNADAPKSARDTALVLILVALCEYLGYKASE